MHALTHFFAFCDFGLAERFYIYVGVCMPEKSESAKMLLLRMLTDCQKFNAKKVFEIFGKKEKLPLYLHPLNEINTSEAKRVQKKFFQVFLRKICRIKKLAYLCNPVSKETWESRVAVSKLQPIQKESIDDRTALEKAKSLLDKIYVL